MTRYYKATARGVTVSRGSDRREYSHAVISWLRPAAPDRWRPDGLPARAAMPSFHSTRELAEIECANRRRRSEFVEWAEVAPVEEIDAKAYRALKAAERSREYRATPPAPLLTWKVGR